MLLKPKTVELSDVLLSLANKRGEAWGFEITNVSMAKTAAEYDACVKFDSGSKPSWDEVQEEYNDLVAQSVAEQYKYDRMNEYPSIVDQLDKIFHEGVDAWKADIQAIKDKYPKP